MFALRWIHPNIFDGFETTDKFTYKSNLLFPKTTELQTNTAASITLHTQRKAYKPIT